MSQNVRRLDGKSADQRILDISIASRNSVSKLVLSVISGIAEFERSLMLEGQHEGTAKAKVNGRYKGMYFTSERLSGINQVVMRDYSRIDVAGRHPVSQPDRSLV